LSLEFLISDCRALASVSRVYDGSWVRQLGTDGGKTLNWTGRIVTVGAVTTAWDKAHAVIATIGDRFVLVRMDSNGKNTRVSAGRQALSNTGLGASDASRTRQGCRWGHCWDVHGGDCAHRCRARHSAAADLVTLARTGVEYDYGIDRVEELLPHLDK
jgi:hypothetical protein